MPIFVPERIHKKIIAMIKLLVAVMLMSLCAAVHAEYADHRNRKVDSLEHVLRNGTRLSEEQLIGLRTDLMWGYLPTDGQRARTNARAVLALSYELDRLDSRVDALRLLGLLAYGGERFDESIAYYEWALAVTDSMQTSGKYKETDIDDNLSSLYGSIGNLYNLQDKNLLAIEYYQKAMPIFEKYGWRESLSVLHHNIAELYLAMGNAGEAERHYRLSLEQGMAAGDSLMMALPMLGLANIFTDRDDYRQAHEMIGPAYAYFRAHQDENPGNYAEVLAALAKMNLTSGNENLPQAKSYAREAIAALDDEMMTETRCEVFAAAAMVEMKMKNWPTALEYALQSVHENDEEATLSDVGSYEALANIYMQLGNKVEASRYISKVHTMMERFSSQNYQSSVSQMEVIYKTEQKQRLIEQLRRERQWHLWGGILLSSSLLLLALAFFLLWRSVRLQRRTALFKARFDGEVAERRRIARDLHDGLGGMLTILRLKVEGDAPKTELLRQLGDASAELRHVAHHLMPEQLLKNGLVTSLRDLAISVPGARFSHFGNVSRLNQDLEVVIYRCAYELVNNAVKHARPDRIDIQLMQEEGQVTLTVSNNGKGVSADSANGGMGLQNIRERISHYHGTMNIVSGEMGTETNIILPI